MNILAALKFFIMAEGMWQNYTISVPILPIGQLRHRVTSHSWKEARRDGDPCRQDPCSEPLRSACLSQRGEEIPRPSYIKAVDIRPLLTYKTGRVLWLILTANCRAANTERRGHVHPSSLEMRHGPQAVQETVQRPVQV